MKLKETPDYNGPALEEAAECLKVLAHPARIRIVQMLLRGRYTVGELAEDCGIPSNVASEHLRLTKSWTVLKDVFSSPDIFCNNISYNHDIMRY